HADDLRGAQVGPIREGGKPHQVRQQDRDFSLLAFERIGEATARQSHEALRWQAAPSGAEQTPEQSAVTDRPNAKDGSEGEARDQDRTSHRQPVRGRYQSASPAPPPPPRPPP